MRWSTGAADGLGKGDGAMGPEGRAGAGRADDAHPPEGSKAGGNARSHRAEARSRAANGGAEDSPWAACESPGRYDTQEEVAHQGRVPEQNVKGSCGAAGKSTNEA